MTATRPTPGDGVCFVVSPIGAAGTPIRERADLVLEYIVRPAAERNKLRAERADDITAPGAINAQVISRLISAEAVVADLTGLNANVFYELAVRDSFRRAVVLIAEEGTDLPFDIIQQRTIFLDHKNLRSADEATDRIAAALRDALADPGAASPVARAAELNALSTGDAEQRQVADLSDQIGALRAEVHTLVRETPFQRALRERQDWSPPDHPDGLDPMVVRVLLRAVTHLPDRPELKDSIAQIATHGLGGASSAQLALILEAVEREIAPGKKDEAWGVVNLVQRELQSRGSTSP
jgi:hypothetical protein